MIAILVFKISINKSAILLNNKNLLDDEEALDAFKELTRVEGIMPALETAHGIAYVKKIAPTMSEDQSIVVNVSGRGDKDINTVASIEGIEL